MSETVRDRSLAEYGVVGIAAMLLVLFVTGAPFPRESRIVGAPSAALVLKPSAKAPVALELPPAPNAPELFSLYQAAKDGDAAAAFDLGNLYATGADAPPDYEAAIRWFARAAAQGLADAQYNLAVFYAKGYGVPKDPERAFPLFEAAALQGLPDAQIALGLAYHDGVGTSPDFVKAAQWFSKAAAQGHPNAYYLLARSYDDGFGVKRDPVEALKWMILTERKGGEDLEFRQYLNGILTPAQQEEARKRADAFKASPLPASPGH